MDDSPVNPATLVERRPRPTRHSTTVVARLTGATTRQLGYWVSQGLYVPHHRGRGSGDPHVWSRDDVAAVRRVLARLRAGYTLAAAFAAEGQEEVSAA